MEHSERDAGPEVTALLRQIPAVNEMLNRTALKELEARVGRRLVVECTRRVVQRLRDRIVAGSLSSVSLVALEQEIVSEAEDGRPLFSAACHQCLRGDLAHQSGPGSVGA